MVLDEIWSLVNFSLMTPSSLIIIMKSLVEKFKSGNGYKEVHERIAREMERSGATVVNLSAIVTAFIGFSVVFVIMVVLAVFPKTRQMAKKKLREVKKEMIWNGAIICF